ncbi:hypothetical protein P8452_29199 [Trifolium repens]|nr:hypothetical protein P8452_29199 [Trifolium repens]
MHVQSESVAAHEFEEKGAFYALEFLLSGLWFMVAREKKGWKFEERIKHNTCLLVCFFPSFCNHVQLRFKKGYDTIMLNKIAKLKGLSMTDREDNDSDAPEEFKA